MERHLGTVWESVGDAIGARMATVQGDRCQSWSEFELRSARLASALVAAGLGPGSKVALYLYNGPEYLEVYFAALKIRAVPVNVNYRYLDDELAYLLTDSDAEAIVFHASLGDRVERVRDRLPRLRLVVEVDDGATATGADRYEDVVAGHDPAPRIIRDPTDATMLYTGGTTGLPKGVLGTAGGAVDTLLRSTPPLVGLAPLTDPADVAPLAAQLAEQDRSLTALPACPLMHGTGIAIGTLPTLTFGGTIVLLDGRGLDADELWSTVERERVQVLTIVGDAFARPLLRNLEHHPDRDLTCVALICSAGAMFSVEVRRGLLDYLDGALILDFIAASEGSMGIALSTGGAVVPTGRFTPNPGVKVLTEDGSEVAPGSGESGMVAITDPNPGGYYKDDAKTARTFPVVDGVRYSIPGDWATVDTDGSLNLLGRGSQCINTGGEKVYPEEVEEAVKRHVAVEDCLVFGVDDERFGQRVVGVASVREGATATGEAIVETMRGELADYKLPRRLVIVDDVPRAANGKADYPSARACFEQVVTKQEAMP